MTAHFKRTNSFHHHGGYSDTSSLVGQQQLEALRRELAAKDEANFDLSGTLATVEAETSHRVQQVEKESGDAVKKLEEQLRRAQQEANMARSQAVQLQTKLRQQDQQL
jgi:TolA-binding protein